MSLEILPQRLGTGDSPTFVGLTLSGAATVGTTLGVTGVLTATGGVTVGTATLLTSSVALTNGAGVASGTLTNAPAAGNPTKWIPISDNGTTRFIPAW